MPEDLPLRLSVYYHLKGLDCGVEQRSTLAHTHY